MKPSVAHLYVRSSLRKPFQVVLRDQNAKVYPQNQELLPLDVTGHCSFFGSEFAQKADDV